MAIIPVIHPNATAREILRRGLRGSRSRVVACRSVERIRRYLVEELVDAIVLDVRRGTLEVAMELVGEFPSIPVFAYSAFRPADGELISQCMSALSDVFVIGVDEAVMGEAVAAGRASRALRRELGDAPRLLRLAEPLQLDAWEEILERVDEPTTTGALAATLGVSREHLSREFAAGGAPNLKRVIDLARLACVAQLLSNPAYSVATVARILNFSSGSHLAESARRIADARPKDLAQLGPKAVLRRFARGRTRSRL